MSNTEHSPSEIGVFRHPAHFLAFGLGSGCSPVAPGTAGTLVAVALWYPLQWLPLGGYLLAVAGALLLGIWLCGFTARALGTHDHGGIVWDEFVGFWIAMIAVPAQWYWVLAGFLLFRLFDILKPWPIRWLDRQVKGGFGIMIDDVVAGLYALACLQAGLVFLNY